MRSPNCARERSLGSSHAASFDGGPDTKDRCSDALAQDPARKHLTGVVDTSVDARERDACSHGVEREPQARDVTSDHAGECRCGRCLCRREACAARNLRSMLSASCGSLTANGQRRSRRGRTDRQETFAGRSTSTGTAEHRDQARKGDQDPRCRPRVDDGCDRCFQHRRSPCGYALVQPLIELGDVVEELIAERDLRMDVRSGRRRR